MSEYIIINTESDGWICSGKGLLNILNPKLPILGLEIGCDVGDTANYLLSNLPNLVLHGVDPYVNCHDWNGRFLDDREDAYQKILDRCSKFGERFIMHRDFSNNLVNSFEDESLDFIFIDGLHTYEQLTKDCKNYYSKVKTGGIFSGHDYNVIPGVNKAVNEFAKELGKEILTTDCDVWYWIK